MLKVTVSVVAARGYLCASPESREGGGYHSCNYERSRSVCQRCQRFFSRFFFHFFFTSTSFYQQTKHSSRRTANERTLETRQIDLRQDLDEQINLKENNEWPSSKSAWNAILIISTVRFLTPPPTGSPKPFSRLVNKQTKQRNKTKKNNEKRLGRQQLRRLLIATVELLYY